ncbi:hypothetical protein CYMTET_41334 [Cymbomonas tetramitiformis]|uniref:Uncharacterized protein n=1 Tax=Cymbomonas tetramitiformis TaxID=36881 RepID=A0AAE0C841_9CHLO|nr:hypothetical protein CYMTET_41334 [Cymbomonas tetramitiformis]
MLPPTTGTSGKSEKEHDYVCVGPWLIWDRGTEDDFEKFKKDFNGGDQLLTSWANTQPGSRSRGSFQSQGRFWRDIFTLRPEKFVDVWSPMFFGILALFQHISPLKWGALSGTWMHVCVYHVFISFFGVFGYAGNFGIITGFLCVFNAFIAMCLQFYAPEEHTGMKLRSSSSSNESGARMNR